MIVNARSLRSDSAPAEQILWSYLRARRHFGLYFRRQHPIAGFIVDFYCAKFSLAIELDGDSHFDEAGVSNLKDERRTMILNEAGVRVIRFTNTDVFDNIDAVLEKVARECKIESV